MRSLWKVTLNRSVKLASSVASVLLLCNPVFCGAEEQIDGFHLGGYASANFRLHPGGRADATVSDASLFLSWDGGERVRLFSEIEIEDGLTWRSGESMTVRRASLDMERLYADYDLNDRATVRLGRFLTPAGRWNQIHADPLVWTTHRPLATEELFPLNLNGLMLHGTLPVGHGGVEYALFGEVVHDMRPSNDEMQYSRARGARLMLSGAADLGVTVMDFREESPGNPHYRLLGLDFVAARNGWEASGEVFQRFRVGDGHGDPGRGGYLQGVAPLGGRWFGVARLEAVQHLSEGTIRRGLVGAAWRMDERRVFKLDYSGGSAESLEAPKGLFASFAILF